LNGKGLNGQEAWKNRGQGIQGDEKARVGLGLW